MAPGKDYWILFAIAMLIAAASAATGMEEWREGLGFTLMWAGLVVFALFRFRWRGLWLLIGAPVALYVPFHVFMLYWACAHGSCI